MSLARSEPTYEGLKLNIVTSDMLQGGRFGAYLRGIETSCGGSGPQPSPSFGAYLRGIETWNWPEWLAGCGQRSEPTYEGLKLGVIDFASAREVRFGAYLRGIETLLRLSR